jgi:hypothetical protein
MYEVFAPMTNSTAKSRKEVMRLIQTAPGFVGFLNDIVNNVSVITDAHDYKDASLGLIAVMANQNYARSLRSDLETVGIAVQSPYRTTHVSTLQMFRAASIAFAHNPCAAHWVELEKSMALHQAAFNANREG